MKKTIQLLFIIVMAGIPSMLAGQTSLLSKNSRFIFRDEGLSQLSMMDQGSPKNNWTIPIQAGRDLQLVGNNLVMIGTGNGYEEYDITTGKKINEITSFKGSVSAHRLRNGNTMLTGLDMADKKGVVLLEIDKAGVIQRTIHFPQFNYVRLARPTVAGTFLITSDSIVFESDYSGKILWQAKVISKKRPHAWQALRLKDGKTIVSGGFAANFQIYASDGAPVTSISGPADVNPYFFSGFQILKNGNYVVANWQGHGPGHGASGTQILEYSPQGNLVGSWKQDPNKYSSIQGLIVLDGLNLKRLHVEDESGVLVPVKE